MSTKYAKPQRSSMLNVSNFKRATKITKTFANHQSSAIITNQNTVFWLPRRGLRLGSPEDIVAAADGSQVAGICQIRG